VIHFAEEHAHPHCHWTYRHGNYESPWFWPTREEAEQASRVLMLDPRVTEAPEIHATHAPNCACVPQQEGVPA
jgi:hypothetical protein